MKKIIQMMMIMFLVILTGCGSDKTQKLPEVSKKVWILDQKVADEENPSLFYVPNKTIEEREFTQLFSFQGNLLAQYLMYDEEKGTCDMEISLISLQTGKLLGETVVSDMYSPVLQMANDYIALSDYETGVLRLLNPKLKVVKEYQLDPGTIYLNSDATMAYCFTLEDGLYRWNLQSGKREKMMEQAYDLTANNQYGDYITLTYVDGNTNLNETSAFSLETEEIEKLDINKSFYDVSYKDGTWMAGYFGMAGENNYLLGTQENPKVLTIETDEWICFSDNPENMMVSKYLDNSLMNLSLYQKDGTYLSSCTVKNTEDSYHSNLVWDEASDGYFFVITSENKSKLYFWDMSVQMEGENLKLAPFETGKVEAGDALSDEYYEKAQNISKAYGVNVKIADQCDTEYVEYVVEQELEKYKVSQGLTVLEQALAAYPEGFVEQLPHGSYKEIEINLMGTIKTKEENENAAFSEFSAFVTMEENKIIMVMDLNREWEMKRDFHHEMSHVIDSKLEFCAGYREDAVYSEQEWDSLNPEGFAYTFSRTEVPDSYYEDGYDDYFIDVYSRTFPTEDRARVFEYAMAGETYWFLEEKGLREKLDYYCRCIRDGFDTACWPEKTAWEILKEE